MSKAITTANWRIAYVAKYGAQALKDKQRADTAKSRAKKLLQQQQQTITPIITPPPLPVNLPDDLDETPPPLPKPQRPTTRPSADVIKRIIRESKTPPIPVRKSKLNLILNKINENNRESVRKHRENKRNN